MWQMVLLFGVSVGGIYVGFFSPTEAAAVGTFGAIVLGFATGRLGLHALSASVIEAARTTGMLFLIVIMAFVFSYFLVQTRIPAGVVTWVRAAGFSPLTVMLILVGLYLILGCFLDALGMILITVPVFLPLIVELGFDPIWFGILLVVLVEVALITPPVGMNLFVIRAQHRDIPIGTIYRGIVPFLAADAVLIALLFAVPGIALWLPGTTCSAPSPGWRSACCG